MTLWPKKPVIYEINTWVWLHDLSERYGRSVTLSTVPLNEWNDLASLGVDAVWLMGVWERSPAGVRISLRRPDLQAEYRRALPNFSEKDVV